MKRADKYRAINDAEMFFDYYLPKFKYTHKELIFVAQYFLQEIIKKSGHHALKILIRKFEKEGWEIVIKRKEVKK